MKAVLTLLLLSAAVERDIRTGRISNRLILCGIFLGLLIQTGESGIKGMASFVICISVPVILFYLLFLMRALGAGDIKLFSAVGSIWNVRILGITIAAAFLAAAVMSFCKLIYHHNLYSRLLAFREYLCQCVAKGRLERYPREPIGEQNVIHFSVAILIGFLTALGVGG